jgi:drug/metabolite transporter (DMT)-like permease
VQAGWIGDALGLSAAVGYAGYLLIVRALGKEMNTGAVMFWATASSALVALALALAFHERLAPMSLNGWLILIALGLICHVGGQGLIAYGVGRLPIVASTVLLWMQPLVAAVLSWIMFGEALGALALLGAALILAGIYVVQRARSGP